MTLFDVPGSDEYEVLEEVGHGTFSEVHLAKHRSSGQLVALKHMFLQEEGVLPLHVRRELHLLRTLRHPGVVSLLDVKQQGFSVALVLEHCVADLRQLLARLQGQRLDAAVAKAAAQQLLAALAACHAAGFAHRDVGPSNILIAPDGTLRLADFGQSRRLRGAGSRADGAPGGQPGGSSSNAKEPCDSIGGGELTPGAALCTRWYKAPELLFNSRSYDERVDVWGAGCLLAELLAGRPLFPGTSDISQLALMADLLGSIDERRWPGVQELPDWGKLVFREQEPLGLAGALPGASPAAVELVEGLVRYCPAQRLSAQAALDSPYFREEPAPAPPEALAAVVRRLLD